MRISDQTSALKLAICDDIGERSYDFADVAAILVQMLMRHPAVGQFSYKLRFEINLLIIFRVQMLTQKVIYKQGLEMVDFEQPQNITYFATRVSDIHYS